MSEWSEWKPWQAYIFEAVEFAKGAGGENMSAENRAVYEDIVRAANAAAARHDVARAAEADEEPDTPYWAGKRHLSGCCRPHDYVNLFQVQQGGLFQVQCRCG